MAQNKINSFIQRRVQEMAQSGALVEVNYDSEVISELKSEFKKIKSWINFIQIHLSDGSMKMNDKCKKIYNIISVLHEAQSYLEQLPKDGSAAKEIAKWMDIIDAAKKEWKRNYAASTFDKLEKQLADYDYSKVQPELISNFLATHWQSKAEAVLLGQ